MALKKKIVIFGGSGYIGKNLVSYLISNGYDIIRVLRKKSNRINIREISRNERIILVDDIRDDLPMIFENGFDIVINAITNYGKTGNFSLAELIDINIQLPSLIVESSIKYGSTLFINFDTSLSANVNAYSETKSTFRNILINNYSNDITVINLVLEKVYGPGDSKEKFITHAIDKLKNNDVLEMTYGEQKYDWIYIDDVVEAIESVLLNEHDTNLSYQEIEIGTGKVIKLNELVSYIKDTIGSQSTIALGKVPYRKNEPMFSCADISKLKGWQPKYTVYDVDFKRF